MRIDTNKISQNIVKSSVKQAPEEVQKHFDHCIRTKISEVIDRTKQEICKNFFKGKK